MFRHSCSFWPADGGWMLDALQWTTSALRTASSLNFLLGMNRVFRRNWSGISELT
jgi:hypothetical protein